MASALSDLIKAFHFREALLLLGSGSLFSGPVLALGEQECVMLQQVDVLERYLFEHPQDIKARTALQRLLSLPPCNSLKKEGVTPAHNSIYHAEVFVGWDSNPAQISDQRLVRLTTDAGMVSVLNGVEPYSTWFQAVRAGWQVSKWNMSLFWRHDQKGLREHRISFQGEYPLVQETVAHASWVLGLVHDVGETGYRSGFRNALVFPSKLRVGWDMMLERYPNEPLFDAVNSQLYLRWPPSYVGQFSLTGGLRQPLSADWPGGGTKIFEAGWEKEITIRDVVHGFGLAWQYTKDSQGWSPLLERNAVRNTARWTLRWWMKPLGRKRYSLFAQWVSQQSNLSLFSWTQLQMGVRWRFE